MNEEYANKVVDSCESTNDVCRVLGEAGYPHGTWASTREQVKGRGRLGREWKSLRGNLFLSLIARVEERAVWTWIPLAAAVGVAHALRSRWPQLPVRIKWPNDLQIHAPGAAPAKLGGILCEGVGNKEGSFIVIGLGLNCAIAPEGLDQLATSLTAATGKPVSDDDIREEVIEYILTALDSLVLEGTEELAAAFGKLAALPTGAEVEWTSGAGGPPRTGHVVGLGPNGELKVRVGTDEVALYAEDVKVRGK